MNKFWRIPCLEGKWLKWNEDDIREMIESPYRIIYQVNEQCIHILTVMHSTRILREIPGLNSDR